MDKKKQGGRELHADTQDGKQVKKPYRMEKEVADCLRTRKTAKQ
jgi:hypothetical protein